VRADLLFPASGRKPKEILAPLERYTAALRRASLRDPQTAARYFDDLFAQFVAARPTMTVGGVLYRVEDVFVSRGDPVASEVWARLVRVTESVTGAV
jgi:hypothetical protein